jgi:hypothetical protein
MEEVWKEFKNYEASNLGRVRNPRTGKLLNPSKDKYGYLYVSLYKDGIRTTGKIHRMVAEAFIPNPQGLPIVNHKDENKENNRVDNLEWCDDKYSINYGTRTEKAAVARYKTVYQYTLDGQLVRMWTSPTECGMNGYIPCAIYMCCNGQRNKHKGFRWSYNPPA